MDEEEDDPQPRLRLVTTEPPIIEAKRPEPDVKDDDSEYEPDEFPELSEEVLLKDVRQYEGARPGYEPGYHWSPRARRVLPWMRRSFALGNGNGDVPSLTRRRNSSYDPVSGPLASVRRKMHLGLISLEFFSEMGLEVLGLPSKI